MTRIAMITGGAAGIGAATAERLAARGMRLFLVDKDARALQARQASLGVEVHAEVVDVTQRGELEAAIARASEKLGVIDVLVNNVGGSTDPTPVDQLTDEQWSSTMTANMTTMFLCTRAVVPGMKARRWGRIVNVSSIAGRTRTHFTNAAYTAAKAGMIGFSRQCAAELAPFGITVNVVAPGVIATARIAEVWEKKSEEEKARLTSLIPAGRLGRPEECASAIAGLCEEDAGYTTGAVLDVSGGMFIG